jgi:hypothetical protein
MNPHEHIHPLALRRDKAVLLFLAISVGANQLETFLRKGGGKFRLHIPLGRPAHAIRRKAQIAARNQDDFIILWLRNLLFPACHDCFLPFSVIVYGKEKFYTFQPPDGADGR